MAASSTTRSAAAHDHRYAVLARRSTGRRGPRLHLRQAGVAAPSDQAAQTRAGRLLADLPRVLSVLPEQAESVAKDEGVRRVHLNERALRVGRWRRPPSTRKPTLGHPYGKPESLRELAPQRGFLSERLSSGDAWRGRAGAQGSHPHRAALQRPCAVDDRLRLHVVGALPPRHAHHPRILMLQGRPSIRRWSSLGCLRSSFSWRQGTCVARASGSSVRAGR